MAVLQSDDAVSRSDNDGDEAPLDPAAERLRRKLVRLLVVSFGIMALGLAAVVAAIIYKINEGNDVADIRAAGVTAARGSIGADTMIAGTIELPAGARILTASLDGDHALITIGLPDGKMQLLVLDLVSGKILVRHDLNTR